MGGGAESSQNPLKETSMAERRATVTWEGNLTDGRGSIRSDSGALVDLPVTFSARMESPEGMTSPEELLAAAEAECYSMVLTNMLSKQGNTPNRLEVTTTCTVVPRDGGLKITTMDLDVSGDVPGVDQDTFVRLANEANQACPVSNALRGNLEFTVNARLGQAAGSRTGS
jgi:osmotically inducible protein OsmC